MTCLILMSIVVTCNWYWINKLSKLRTNHSSALFIKKEKLWKWYSSHNVLDNMFEDTIHMNAVWQFTRSIIGNVYLYYNCARIPSLYVVVLLQIWKCKPKHLKRNFPKKTVIISGRSDCDGRSADMVADCSYWSRFSAGPPPYRPAHHSSGAQSEKITVVSGRFGVYFLRQILRTD